MRLFRGKIHQAWPCILLCQRINGIVISTVCLSFRFLLVNLYHDVFLVPPPLTKRDEKTNGFSLPCSPSALCSFRTYPRGARQALYVCLWFEASPCLFLLKSLSNSRLHPSPCSPNTSRRTKMSPQPWFLSFGGTCRNQEQKKG